MGVRVTTYLDESKIIFAIRGPSFVDVAFCIREKVRNRRIPQFTEYRGGVGKSIQKSCYFRKSRFKVYCCKFKTVFHQWIEIARHKGLISWIQGTVQ